MDETGGTLMPGSNGDQPSPSGSQQPAQQQPDGQPGSGPQEDGAKAEQASPAREKPEAGQTPDVPQGQNGGPDLDLVMRIPVTVQAVLGEAKMSISRLMKLGPGSVVPLNRQVGEPVDVMVNGRLVARGEVVLLEEDSNRFGISLTEIVEAGSHSC